VQVGIPSGPRGFWRVLLDEPKTQFVQQNEKLLEKNKKERRKKKMCDKLKE